MTYFDFATYLWFSITFKTTYLLLLIIIANLI